MSQTASLSMPENATFVLFGALGDLTWRLVGPALFDLYCKQQLPAGFTLIGVDRAVDTPRLVERLRDGATRFADAGNVDTTAWDGFAACIRGHAMDLTDASAYAGLKDLLHDPARPRPDAIVLYLAIPPGLFARVANGLAQAGLARDRQRVRIVVEKPLGHDLASYRVINAALADHFHEQQIFRMDHFLGKETVQNILAMRFANPIFEPIWNRRYIDHVTVTVAETLGVEHRAGYYEHAGALRDMVQNHLMQLMCLVAMESPVAYDADDIRNKKLDVLRACRRIPESDVGSFAVRGQYDAGWIEGEAVPGYREEPAVSPTSAIETYAAVKLLVDNWRWQGVPFYLRTGKRLAQAASEISVRFRDVPHNAFPAVTGLNAEPVRLVIQIQPQQGVILKFMAKEPGSPLRLRPVDMRFSYGEAFGKESPGAYETLLHDVLLGDATLFMRSDQVEAAWELLQPVLDAWANNPPADFPNYRAGSPGPEAAERLVAMDGHAWLRPTCWKSRESGEKP
jgi:glucose-6-phosphate 1-dehydrogenase